MSNEEDVRYAATTIYRNTNMYSNRQYQYPSFDSSTTRSHSINYLAEDFIAGYMHDGRMSVVRRFFCLFVTFDLVFISLLWLICILITGDNVYNAFKTQILHYSIYTSLFDIVMASICRFTVLLLFYALLYINHWCVIALSTSGSCLFLIVKYSYYHRHTQWLTLYSIRVQRWISIPQPVFQVLLIVISFVLAWGEAWFLDFRVIPQEHHARNYFRAATSGSADDRTPLLAPFLHATQFPPESLHFYSPFESIHNSDNEDDEKEEYINMGNECVRRAYELLETGDWKIEKVTPKDDTIKSSQQDKLGKIYRLTAKLDFPAKALLEKLFYDIEDIPKWNPTILESKIIKKIDSHTDITYQATLGGGGGLVKCRDFVNLRCWQLCRNGEIIFDNNSNSNVNNNLESTTVEMHNIIQSSNLSSSPSPIEVAQPSASTSSVLSEQMPSSSSQIHKTNMQKASSDFKINETLLKTSPNYSTLSKSLGAKNFSDIDILSIEDEPFVDAEDKENIGIYNNELLTTKPSKSLTINGNVYVSAAVSINYPGVPATTKYIRGENLISCWAMREIAGKNDSCIFEWLLCIDLKGYVPRSVLNTAYTTLMQDYMSYLRKYCEQIRSKQIKVPEDNSEIN